VGRQAAAATDLHLQAEIFSYARSRGLFVGASFDGSMIEVDGIANASYYRSPAPGQPVVVPATGVQLAQQVAAYTTATVPAPAAGPIGLQPTGPAGVPGPQAPLLAQQYATHESDVLRAQLSKTAPELFRRLDPAWTNFLALPPEVFIAQGHPAIEPVDLCLQRYNAVVVDAQYRGLATLPAFQSTHGLLSHYASSLRAESTVPQLPPPPVMR
jgi:SH3 domain-containing YSC84-like protein 1